MFGSLISAFQPKSDDNGVGGRTPIALCEYFFCNTAAKFSIDLQL